MSVINVKIINNSEKNKKHKKIARLSQLSRNNCLN